MRLLADTNIILRFLHVADPRHEVVFAAVRGAFARGESICIAPQVIYEFWSVATRPVNVGGLGWSVARTHAEVDVLLEQFELIADSPSVFEFWLELVTIHGVSGKPSHDARLVAAMQAHGLETLLTLNGADFKRFDINVVDPNDVQS